MFGKTEVYYYICVLFTTKGKQHPNQNYTKMATIPNKTKAHKIIAAELKKAAKQSVRTDATRVAVVIGKSEALVRMYMQGKVFDFNTGSYILTELRRLIANREEEALALVA